MQFLSAVISGSGKLREENQDNYYLDGAYRDDLAENTVRLEEVSVRGGTLCAVADGMGGEKHGELASLMTVRGMDSIDRSAGAGGIVQYLLERNDEICRFMEQNGRARTGSTFVGLCLDESGGSVVNIGDSRAYLFRKGRLAQLSQDHTPVRSMLELGVLTPEAAKRHPDRHKLTQHLGIFPEELVIEPYTAGIDVRPGDLFLLCSDGLYDMVDDSRIRQILAEGHELRDTVSALYRQAMEAGGRDNITALLVQIKA